MLLPNHHRININTGLKPPLRILDGDVVPAHLALAHEAVGGESPVLEAVRAPPLAGGIVPLVPELHGDLIIAEGEQLLAQPVSMLALPFLRQERGDGVPALEERGAVAPDAVGRVGHFHFFGVSGAG